MKCVNCSAKAKPKILGQDLFKIQAQCTKCKMVNVLSKDLPNGMEELWTINNGNGSFKWTSLQKERLRDVQKVLDDLKEYYPVTLRQVHYQLVGSVYKYSKAWRTSDPYKNILSPLLKQARLDGLIPWSVISDEHRTLSEIYSYNSASDFIDQQNKTYLTNYRLDRMKDQSVYIEVLIEKMTLYSIIKRITDKYDIKLMVCRGFNSISFLKSFADRMKHAKRIGLTPIALQFGDHDPSGISAMEAMVHSVEYEMGVKDIKFMKGAITGEQLEEIDQYKFPINSRDKRAETYLKEYGSYGWELDSFHPKRLQELVRKGIEYFLDLSTYKKNLVQEKADLEAIKKYKNKIFKRGGDASAG